MINRRKRDQTYAFVGSLYVIVITGYMVAKYTIAYQYSLRGMLVPALLVALAAVIIGFLLLFYLRGSHYSSDERAMISGSVDSAESKTVFGTVLRLNDELHDLRRQVALISQGGQALQQEDKESMLVALRGQFAEALVSEVEERNCKAAAEKAGLVPIQRALDTSAARLQEELQALGRRGNLNLVIGTMTTCAAVGLLVYMVLGHGNNDADISAVLNHYIPRISTVIFIEIFGFFFLRLYKSGLAELKYYQNELTTLALVRVAVEMVARASSPESFTKFAQLLVEKDRNNGVKNGSLSNGNQDEVLEKALSTIPEVAKVFLKAK